MLNRPTVAQLLAKGNTRYSLVIATAKRARQIAEDRERRLKNGEQLTEYDEDHKSPITAACNEIYDGKILIYDKNEWDKIVSEKEESRRIDEEKARHLEEIKMQSLQATNAEANKSEETNVDNENEENKVDDNNNSTEEN